MSRVLTDFNPSWGKRERHLCQGAFHTHTKGPSVPRAGAGWDTAFPDPGVRRGTRPAPALQLLYYAIAKLKQGAFKAVPVISGQDND